MSSEHMRDTDLAGDPDTFETDIDGFVPLLLSQFPIGREGVDASIGNYDVDWS
ncbi:MAG: hypothetical protein NVS4B11_00230 [Ktedonobacteraceae bacterium]